MIEQINSFSLIFFIVFDKLCSLDFVKKMFQTGKSSCLKHLYVIRWVIIIQKKKKIVCA